MTSEFLLETIENHFKEILGKLGHEERDKLTDLLRQLMAVEDESIFEEAKNLLYNFCLGNSFLQALLLKAEAGKTKSVVFRGKPIPQSTTEKSKRIRLKANRLIDAIEKENHSPAETKNEKSN